MGTYCRQTLVTGYRLLNPGTTQLQFSYSVPYTILMKSVFTLAGNTGHRSLIMVPRISTLKIEISLS